MRIAKDIVIVLGGNKDQHPYIVELKKLGYQVHLYDINENCIGRNLCDQFFIASYENINELERIFLEQSYDPKNTKIFSAASQYSLPGAARVAKYLQQPFPEEAYLSLFLNKRNFYDIFKNHEIPIPKTIFISSNDQLENELIKQNGTSNFYLKSDFGKSPNYIYKFNKLNLNKFDINWKTDRYLKDGYLLQPEVLGRHLRVNIYNGGFRLYDFFDQSGVVIEPKTLPIFEDAIHGLLSKLISNYNLENFIVKFDIIVGNDRWCALDIGLDPPLRMKNEFLRRNINFYHLFIRQYFGDKLVFSNYE